MHASFIKCSSQIAMVLSKRTWAELQFVWQASMCNDVVQEIDPFFKEREVLLLFRICSLKLPDAKHAEIIGYSHGEQVGGMSESCLSLSAICPHDTGRW
jgi:hypothetical protein